jgi:hypothetical protein
MVQGIAGAVSNNPKEDDILDQVEADFRNRQQLRKVQSWMPKTFLR